MIKIINGDSIKELKKFPDNYFHSVVTDAPYGLSIMGKKWDYDVPSVELWQEVFRVLKEGGYLLCFAGTRTQHRMAVNIEDAGFEIRDMIAWVYGSGFPKSHNIGRAVDKLQGNEREIYNKPIAYPDSDCWGVPNKNKPLKKTMFQAGSRKMSGGFVEDTKGTSEWEGWGTALKPALEPITMARKPFKGTVANNVLKNGVGGINIDDCRVETTDKWEQQTNGLEQIQRKNAEQGFRPKNYYEDKKVISKTHTKGRFPANLIHDGSDEVKDLLEGSSRFFYCAKASKQDRNEGLEKTARKEGFEDKKLKGVNASPRENSGKIKDLSLHKNNHPTVKPTDLMRYLVRLVTVKNGIVLDCFMGSGSTGKACALEGVNFVGIDLDKDYCKIAKARIDKAIEDKRIMESQTKLF